MKNYLFDFDGTLVDSMPTFASTMLRILDENGIQYGDDIVKIITPLGYNDTALYFIRLGVPFTKDEILKKMHEYAIADYRERIEAKPNVISTLKELKARGCHLSVLTASPHEMLDPCLKRLGIYELFDNVWSCADFSLNKAQTEIYERAAEKMGAPVDEIAFLDDNYNADKTAKAAGMKVYGVYDPSSAEYAEEMKDLCDRYITDFSELL